MVKTRTQNSVVSLKMLNYIGADSLVDSALSRCASGVEFESQLVDLGTNTRNEEIKSVLPLS